MVASSPQQASPSSCGNPNMPLLRLTVPLRVVLHPIPNDGEHYLELGVVGGSYGTWVLLVHN
uniref:Uncharacterized protein n=1 Tax=Lotus japonicus TaxID=34305 RepID=I3SEH7_LOTJA|nr:unknown [Lotus japonicus]